MIAPRLPIRKNLDKHIKDAYGVPVDLLISNTYGKYIARDEDVPFLRWGFPILDRQGHQYFPTVGYKGGLRLLEKILNLLLDRKDRDDTEMKFELVL